MKNPTLKLQKRLIKQEYQLDRYRQTGIDNHKNYALTVICGVVAISVLSWAMFKLGFYFGQII